MTEKELLLLAIADLEPKILFLKKESPKMEKEIKQLRKEIDLRTKTGKLICSPKTTKLPSFKSTHVIGSHIA